MAFFTVTSIIDGDTIEVSPKWNFEGRSGKIVKISGYTTPHEQDQGRVTNRLRKLIYNQQIELRNARKFTQDSDALLCNVYLNGIDIAQYFPEYRSSNNPWF
jgi:endonuclease YncB( thermonuclease family)